MWSARSEPTDRVNWLRSTSAAIWQRKIRQVDDLNGRASDPSAEELFQAELGHPGSLPESRTPSGGEGAEFQEPARVRPHPRLVRFVAAQVVDPCESLFVGVS